MSALDKQIGGTHYPKNAIQAIEFVHSNKMGFCEGSIIKYIARHKYKDGKQDLLKARHFIDMLLELEYGYFTNDTKTSNTSNQGSFEFDHTPGKVYYTGECPSKLR